MGADAANAQHAQRIVVFAPAPLLTITIERRGDAPDVHLHAGGQGFWQARMISALGLDVTLCGTFGGEVGSVLTPLIEREGVRVRGVSSSEDNPAYVHDRRGGEREPLAETPWPKLSRHEVDELYTLTIAEAMDADACLLGGTADPHVLPDDVYRRLASDLRRARKLVVADLSGAQLHSAVAGGVSIVKVSHETLVTDGYITDNDREQIINAARRLKQEGAERVLVSRSEQPTIALTDQLMEITPPHFEPVDVKGAGDSITAALASALVRGDSWSHALSVASAAGALNITRRGLATGTREEIEQLASHVTMRSVDDSQQTDEPMTTSPDELAERARPSR